MGILICPYAPKLIIETCLKLDFFGTPYSIIQINYREMGHTFLLLIIMGGGGLKIKFYLATEVTITYTLIHQGKPGLRWGANIETLSGHLNI